jgi:Questin oxidase-like
MRTPSYSSLDEALESLAGYGIELTNGNSNHAPMVAEALCSLGRPDVVMPWVTRYRERMLPRGSAVDPVSREDWRSLLGCRDRFTDWADFFSRELAERAWREVLDRWVDRLAPGFSAAATHGVIRVGHAVRALAAAETPPRMRELADALASWAATYRELPTPPTIGNGVMAPRDGITKLPTITLANRRNLGNITASLAMLDDFPEFAPVIGTINVGGDIDPLLSELTEAFAHIFLTNAHNVLTTIVFIHGVTSLAAFGGIAPQISAATARRALRYAWQTGCALYACFGHSVVSGQDSEPPSHDKDTLIDRAVANGDEHVIKFTEASLPRYAIGPSEAYFGAIDSALAIMARH